MAAISGGAPDRQRAHTFARLFEAVHESVYMGIARVSDPSDGSTLAVNPHLKTLPPHTPKTSDEQMGLFDEEPFVDTAARTAFLTRLVHDGSVTDYLLRLKRRNSKGAWVEVTARV